MRNLLLIVLVISLSACVTYYKPGSTKQDFEVDKANCLYQSSLAAPPSVRQVQIAPAKKNASYTSCSGTNQNGQVNANCMTTGGEYVPPVNINIDDNEGARNAAFQSCMFSNGWSTQKPESEGSYKQSKDESIKTEAPLDINKKTVYIPSQSSDHNFGTITNGVWTIHQSVWQGQIGRKSKGNISFKGDKTALVNIIDEDHTISTVISINPSKQIERTNDYTKTPIFCSLAGPASNEGLIFFNDDGPFRVECGSSFALIKGRVK